MDCKELVAGTTLYLPVFRQGALFAIGDAHAAKVMAKSISPRWKRHWTRLCSSLPSAKI